MLLAFLCVLVGWQQPAPAVQSVAVRPQTFAEVVGSHFVSWDRNRDGVLSPAEIDALCVAPDLRGEQAAAIAALKRIVRSGKFEVPTLSREVLAAPPERSVAPLAEVAPQSAAAPTSGSAGDPDDVDRPDSLEVVPATAPVVSAATEPARAVTLRKPNFAASYQAALRRIRGSRRDLFLDPTPDLDACRQGPLGDCFYVAAIGALAHRDPEALLRMIEPLPDGYRVRFGDGSEVEVGSLTDAEIALSGTTGDEGLWLPVLEKALGSLRQQRNPGKYAMATATDAISRGGSSLEALRMLTGHATTQLALKVASRRTGASPGGAPIQRTMEPAGPLERLEAEVRDVVIRALRERRLVTCSTAQEAQPKGIAQKHAYAVLGYDASTDRLHLWNPHGNTFTPKGEPGRKNGYPTKAGRFSIPVADFVQVFRSCSIESARPQPSAAQPKGRVPDGEAGRGDSPKDPAPDEGRRADGSGERGRDGVR